MFELFLLIVIRFAKQTKLHFFFVHFTLFRDLHIECRLHAFQLSVSSFYQPYSLSLYIFTSLFVNSISVDCEISHSHTYILVSDDEINILDSVCHYREWRVWSWTEFNMQIGVKSVLITHSIHFCFYFPLRIKIHTFQ